MKNSLKTAVKDKEIKHLLHFTKIENLDSILRNGLLGRSVLENSGINHVTNDQYRYDKQESAICCSIGHPNYKMFYPLRQQNTEEQWVVLVIKRVVLWSKACAFCTTNAASNSVTAIPLEDRMGFDPFIAMFSEQEHAPIRSVLAIPDRCPTDPQAEVLVLEGIEPKFIMGAMTDTHSRAKELRAKYPDFRFEYNRTAFLYRKDWKHW